MILISISHGELMDRLSILEVKSHKLQNDVQISYVLSEIQELKEISTPLLLDETVKSKYDSLKLVNEKMWDSMQEIYDWEGPTQVQQYNEVIVAIIEVNKQRATLKREIDVHMNSTKFEAKSFFKSI
jgi:hypothetical protein